MKYHVIHIQTDFAEEWQKEVFDQSLCDLGVETIDGTDYYIQSDILKEKRSDITNFLSPFNFHFSVDECPDENWNAAWEAEHPMQELPLGIRIIPHCAFGAGHHETTSMMIEELLNYSRSPFSHYHVLDHGTGTGVLAIFAKRLGAEYVLAVDIDDKSVENAKENAALNGVNIDVRLGGDLDSLNIKPSTFNLILANIHRNILLAHMPAYAANLAPNGELWLSGFYEEDCPALIASATTHGLHLLATRSNGDWRMLQFTFAPVSQ